MAMAAVNGLVAYDVEYWLLVDVHLGDAVGINAYFDSWIVVKSVDSAGHCDEPDRGCSLPNWMV